jgi:1-deoxy-D-xylulose-5-phosphate reductoisomerase
MYGNIQKQRTITVLGSTGSIGRTCLEIINAHPAMFRAKILTAGSNAELLVEQAHKFRPDMVVIQDASRYQYLKEAMAGSGIDVAAGDKAIEGAAALPSDVVISGIVGIAGLRPTMAAIRPNAIIGIANKECLVTAGNIITSLAQKRKATLVPVDSEHNAIWQVFDFHDAESVESITLTASGGPLLKVPAEKMADVTPEQATKHPNWDMGAKISVDSATMMNKGLELIEAFHLFPVSPAQLEVLVHPESVVHGLVTYRDGVIKAVLSVPDMSAPVAHAMTWPRRVELKAPRLSLEKLNQLTFAEPDYIKFPLLKLANECLFEGGGSPIVLNAANEIAVQAFLEKRIKFTDIHSIVAETLQEINVNRAPEAVEEVLQINDIARRQALQYINTKLSIAA